MLKSTIINTIPHKQQRYETVGDYYQKHGIINVLVSDMNNERYEFLVSIHEQIEEFLTRQRGIKEQDITNFDIAFEENCGENNFDEPGNCLEAPYYREHQFATIIERMIAYELGIDWKEYDETVSHLGDSTTSFGTLS